MTKYAPDATFTSTGGYKDGRWVHWGSNTWLEIELTLERYEFREAPAPRGAHPVWSAWQLLDKDQYLPKPFPKNFQSGVTSTQLWEDYYEHVKSCRICITEHCHAGGLMGYQASQGHL